MKFTRCTIKNFRCFDSISLDFDDRLTVLVAENGGGKTSVLDALGLVIRDLSMVLLHRENREKDPRHLEGRIEARDFHGTEKESSVAVDFDCRGDTRSFKKELQRNPEIELSSVDWVLLRGELSYMEELRNVMVDIDQNPEAAITLITYYDAKRMLQPKRTDRPNVEGGLYQAFYGNHGIGIDFDAALAWFNDHDMRESRTIKHTGNLNYRDPELEAVRQAITTCLDGYENPRMSAEADSRFVISKVGEPNSAYSIEQLSDGYRAMLALVMDVARRMALANSEFCARTGASVLDSPAIILIDEIELHLHPRWQQTVLPTLMKVFPKAQFIVTTHSPQVLTSVARKHIRVLKQVDGQWTAEPPDTSPLAREAGDALAHIMGVDAYPPLYREEIHRYEALVRAGEEDSDEAKTLVKEFGALGLEIPDSDLTLWRFLAERS